MCLTVTNPKVQVAEKDIICFKYLKQRGRATKNLISVAQNFKYKLGKKYSLGFFHKNLTRGKDLSQGYHSFRKIGSVNPYIYENEKNDSSDYTRYVAVLCIIPKGTEYVFGKQVHHQQYLSESIILKEIITKEVAEKLKKKLAKKKIAQLRKKPAKKKK